MKHLTWKLVLPLTVISFTMLTKWWYVDVDGYDEILTGFPLPFVCPGWHTSLSLQIFVLELIVDVLCYFVFWFLMVLAIIKFNKQFHVRSFVWVILLGISGLLTILFTLLAINPDNIYTINRKFDIKIMETGYRFAWEEQIRPDYYKHHPEMQKNE